MGQHGDGVPGGGAERMMTNQELILGVMRAQGKADALDLRARAPELDGTAIIAEEGKVPQFDGTKDYSSWAIGSPVWEEVNGERQIFTLLQPHNAIHYPGSTPSNTPALWSIRHTKDPSKAKALQQRQAGSHIPGQGVRPMRITLHIGRFTVTIIVKSRNRHSAK